VLLGSDVWLWKAVADQNRGRGRDDHVGWVVGEVDVTGPVNKAPARAVPKIGNRSGSNTIAGSRVGPRLELAREMRRRNLLSPGPACTKPPPIS
jgi:hypothetical protein